jgi:SAM-dependent methyltransferase
LECQPLFDVASVTGSYHVIGAQIDKQLTQVRLRRVADLVSKLKESPYSSQVSEWEAAYLRFETPEQEIRKFVKRLRKLGASRWDRKSQVIELFCGRGNGLRALQRLGFHHIDGVDISPALAAQYEGTGRIYVADCRCLPLESCSRDVAIVQGGLHHLASLQDLETVLAEVNRVLRPNGLFVAVEPWLTPFLRLVHALCNVALVRRMSNRFDALATMIEHERTTYEQWLERPQPIRSVLEKQFRTQRCLVGWGKLAFVGAKR